MYRHKGRSGWENTYASITPVLAKPETKNPDLAARVFNGRFLNKAVPEEMTSVSGQFHRASLSGQFSSHGDARAHQTDAVEVRLLAGVFLGAFTGLVALVE